MSASAPVVRALRRLGLLALAMFVLWLGGLAWFVASSLAIRGDPIATDAIVVLTGGRLRLETGLQLWAAGTAKKPAPAEPGAEEEEVEIEETPDDDTFIEEQEEEDADVTDIIGGDIETEEEG